METNVKDRYLAWRADPQTSTDPSLAAAFAEGWMQAMEATHNAPRTPGSMTADELTRDWDA